jgi:hypothetical protein
MSIKEYSVAAAIYFVAAIVAFYFQLTFLASMLITVGAICSIIGGITLIHRSDKNHHETAGIGLIILGSVILVLSLDSSMLVRMKSKITPMGQASVFRAPDAEMADKESKIVTWTYPGDAHSVVWVVVSIDYLNDKPVPRESFAIMTGFGDAPTEFTLPKGVDMDTVETVTVFYGNTKGPSGESIIIVNEPPTLPTSPAVPPSGSPAAGSAVPGTGATGAPSTDPTSI